LVQNEAFYHVLGQDETSDGKGYLLKELVIINTHLVRHVTYQQWVKELFGKH
jgi:hypothetical protein